MLAYNYDNDVIVITVRVFYFFLFFGFTRPYIDKQVIHASETVHSLSNLLQGRSRAQQIAVSNYCWLLA